MSLEAVWFVLLAATLAVYVVLDGLDLGAGIVSRVVARTEAERAALLRSIGPIWDGNEVWLVSAGATLVLAFPGAYAAAFSGFYLPLMITLWLLIGRACAIELRHQVESSAWRPFWDWIFFVTSVLLALGFGAALGNVVRGVPLDSSGSFFEPLWTDFETTGRTGILDGYTLLVGATALAALALHGALWVAVKLDGPPHERGRETARKAWWAVVALTALVTGATFRVQGNAPSRLSEAPWGLAFPALTVGGLAGARWFLARGRERAAFLSSGAYLAGMIASAAFTVWPYVLPSNRPEEGGMTAAAAAASEHGLRVGLGWWIPGVLLAVGYQVFAYRRFRGRVGDDPGGY